jgi:RNA-binding protein YlmH
MDVEFAAPQLMVHRRARLEAGDVVPNRDRIFVLVRRSVKDFIEHRIMAYRSLAYGLYIIG